MADWKKSGGVWCVQTTSGNTGDRVTVRRADGTSSTVTLGTFVTRTRWGRVFAVAGRAAPVARRPRRRRRFNPGVPHPAAILVSLNVATPKRSDPRPTLTARPAVDTPSLPTWEEMGLGEPVDASVARFRLLDLGDDVAPAVDTPDDGPGRRLQID